MIIPIAVLLFAHFIADFILQPHWMAIQKSQKVFVLLAHVGIHLVTFCLFAYGIFGDVLRGVALAAVNAALHGLIDWNVWRMYKRARANAGPHFSPYEDHWFWMTLGADQLLHALSVLLAFGIAASL